MTIFDHCFMDNINEDKKWVNHGDKRNNIIYLFIYLFIWTYAFITAAHVYMTAVRSQIIQQMV